MFCKKGVLKIFAEFLGKHLGQNLFFKEKYMPQACNVIEKEALTQVLSSEFCKIFKETFFYARPPASASLISNYNITHYVALEFVFN